MTKPAYYNELHPDAADRLEDLIVGGHIAPGVVDRRSIEDVRPADLEGFEQCHFFAGFGIWSLALRRAGWPDDRPVWTGSCPCQPFSSAGEGAGFDDERHLWPHFQWLIGERRPAVLYGEQVASKDAEPWLDLVRDDLEGMAYAFGAIAFPSAGVGAPHIRDRTFWVAHATGAGRRPQRTHGHAAHGAEALPTGQAQPGRCSSVGGGLGNAERAGLALGKRVARIPGGASGADAGQAAERAGVHPGGVADASRGGWREERQDGSGIAGGDSAQGLAAGLVHGGGDHRPGPTNGLWRAADWLGCRDGRWRPVEPGTFPLAHGLPRGLGSMQPELRRLAELAGLDRRSLARAKAFRVGSLRGYGNGINAEAARLFIESTM